MTTTPATLSFAFTDGHFTPSFLSRLLAYFRYRRLLSSRFADPAEVFLAAASSTTPAWVLAQLATDTSSVVRAAVASNRSCPAAVLHLLSAPSNPLTVRMAVATNPATAPETLTVLAADFFRPVVEAVLTNPALPGSAVVSARQRFLRHGEPTHTRVASSCLLMDCSACSLVADAATQSPVLV